MKTAYVATGHPAVSESAATMLRAGGNAFDAILAAAFTASIAEPTFTSLGGGGFLLARTADGRARVFDFFADTPGRGVDARQLEPHFVPVTVAFLGSDQVFNIGLGSVATPGNVRGFLHAHEQLGRLPLRDVVAPACGHSRDGLLLTPLQAETLRLLEPINISTAAARAFFAPQGRLPKAGDRLANQELADFLERLAVEGDAAFHEGELAARIATDMAAGGGLLTEDDLHAYRVEERDPLAIPYRDHVLLTNPPPSRGGAMVARSLTAHGRWELGELAWGSAEHLHRLVTVMDEIERAGVPPAAGGTTHLSVVDGEGNAASLSLSNGEGSGYVVPGTGIVLNNMLGEDDLHPDGFHAAPPGERVSSMMAPSMLLKDDELRLVLGSGGSKRIRTAVLQVVSNVVDFGMDVTAAVEAPRLHWDGACVQIESRFEPAAIQELSRTWAVNAWPDRNLYFGGVHAVDPRRGGAGDPRRAGCALAV